MSEKFYYKGYDISGMIQYGTSILSDYFNLPTYTQSSTVYGTSDIIPNNTGFLDFYSDLNGKFTDKKITASSTTIIKTKNEIEIPDWCNAIKVKLVAAKGASGSKGELGIKGATGAAGIKGATGAPGGNGSRSSCSGGRNQPGGAGGPGGDGGAGGAGGEGGEAGDGGDGGAGGEGVIVFSNNLYEIDRNNSVVGVTIDTNNNIKFAIKQSDTEIFKIEVTAPTKGATGGKGGDGATGGQGGTGTNGGNGGRGQNGYCGKSSGSQGLTYGRTGAPGAAGGAGTQGSTGAKGTKGTKGTPGAAGAAATFSTNSTKGSNLDISNNKINPSTTSVTVYFFAL